MIKHLFKIVWNRKRMNLLITAEIFISFLVLFFVVAVSVYFTDNYRRPLGFSYENVWNVAIDMKLSTDDVWDDRMVEGFNQLLLAARDFPAVESVAGAMFPPYSFSNSNSVSESRGRVVRYSLNEVTDEFREVLQLEIVQGRWFGPEDDGAGYEPVVINRRFADEVFGSGDPIGRNLVEGDGSSDAAPSPEMRVVGVVSDFRKDGELAGAENYLFHRVGLNDSSSRPPRNLLLKLRPGTTAEFEERLVQRLRDVVRDWSYEIQPLARSRESALQFRLAPVIALGIVAGFLMIMVVLGLMGVLWQNVTQRTREIGLRRAKGATARRIYHQILGEMFVITTMGLVPGLLIVIQFPLLDLVGFVSGGVYLVSIVVSAFLIYALTALCGLYPSRMATRIQPAQALHYE